MFKAKKVTQKIMAVICAIGLIVGESNVTVSKAAQKPVSLSKTNLTLKLGKSKNIKIKKAIGIKIKKKTFTSSKKKVATITKNGKITAKKAGKTIIKAKVKYLKARKIKTTTLKCTVKVIGNNSTTATTNTTENPVAAPYINPATNPSRSPADSGAMTATPTSSQKPQQTQSPAPTTSQEPTQSPDTSFDITLPREAGLYDADGTMIKTWNELTEDGLLKIMNNHLVSNDYIDATTGREKRRDTSDMVGNLIIPKTITAIYRYSFGYNCGLTGIQIPNSITEIDEYAFDGCGQLERLAVASGNTVYDSRNHCNAIIDTETNTLITGCKNTVIPDTVTSIGSYAFYGCNGLVSIEIPNGVTNIESDSFVECDDLKGIEIPDSVISIGKSSFGNTNYRNSSICSYCSSLENIVVAPGNTRYDSRMNCNAIIDTETNALITGCKNTVIPNTVTSIGLQAFEGCNNLTGIVIPNSVTSIKYEAFFRCTNLSDIVIPDSVTSIESGAFIECKSLTSIVIPDSVTTIEFGGIESSCAFDNDYLESVVVASGNTKYDSRENCNAIIDTKTNTLLFGCKNTVIPNSVTAIGSYSFRGCNGIIGLTIPNSVTTIGEGSFSWCEGLTSLTIPSSVTSIETGAFKYCSNLTGIKMSDGLTEIGSQAFMECNLTSIEIPDSVVSIGWYAFRKNKITSIEIPDNVKRIAPYAFSGNNLDHISVAAENTVYDSRANCNAVINTKENTLEIGCKNTIIPNTVTGIGQGAFGYCANLTNITIPDNIISIKSDAFYAVPLVIYDGDLPVEDWGANQVQRSDGTIIYADKNQQ